VALIDMDALGQFVEQGQLDELQGLKRQVEELIVQMAAQQSLCQSVTDTCNSPVLFVVEREVQGVCTHSYKAGGLVMTIEK
jgi:hypothetical protein